MFLIKDLSQLQTNYVILTRSPYNIIIHSFTVKVGSQCDTRPCIALVCDTKISNSKFSNLFGDQTQELNAKEHEDRIF